MKMLSILLFILLISGCSSNVDSQYQPFVTELEEKGYTVQSFEEHDSFVLTRYYLMSPPNTIHWGLQNINIKDLLGQRVTVFKATVKGHILGEKEGYSRKTQLYLYVIDGELVGGISVPMTKDPIGGAYYSLEGKTFEEVQGKSYAEWEKELRENLK